MSPLALKERILRLEQQMHSLQELPKKVHDLSLQVSQLHSEMLAEFSAVRAEIRAGDEETRRELREEIRAGDEETRQELRVEIRAGDEEIRRELREEIRAGDEETRGLMRVLHEDVVSRLALLQEGLSETNSPRKKHRGRGGHGGP